MKYLFSEWKNVGKALKNKFIYLFLDYDGTLTPIARTPDIAVIPKKTKDLLLRLSNIPNCKVAIVSGRTLKDVSKRIGLRNIVYVGNHGFEIKGPKINFKSPLPPYYKRTLKEVKVKLEKNLSSFRGVFIEDKGFSLSVHYRMADKDDISSIKAGFYNTIFLYELGNDVQVKRGKMLLEVRPPVSWNKGEAVSWLLGRRSFARRSKKMKVMPVYIGDDVTDEDAFESLKDKGITIFVGKTNRTKARFYLKNTEEVAQFLEAILENPKTGILWRKKR
ncbi:MAG: trehalose-phosphatase [Candidatus Omnitrophica bacterium]|nr:trehalose-phosphatase [Candidatus Omnitrophota bacterium]